MERTLVPLAGAALFAGLSALMFWGRPRSLAEERRRRRYNERHKVPYKERIGDTRVTAWFFGLLCGGGAIFSFSLAVWAFLR